MSTTYCDSYSYGHADRDHRTNDHLYSDYYLDANHHSERDSDLHAHKYADYHPYGDADTYPHGDEHSNCDSYPYTVRSPG